MVAMVTEEAVSERRQHLVLADVEPVVPQELMVLQTQAELVVLAVVEEVQVSGAVVEEVETMTAELAEVEAQA